MRWKQFFTPVDSVDAKSARKIIEESPHDTLTILDVRQPKEYKESHIPGAKLIPVSELKDRTDELDPGKKTLVYCAIGGRSRVAAQMLSAQGFDKVYNISGGIKAWGGNIASGPVDQGLELFDGKENVKDVLIVAYSLEKGLREFYLQMIPKVKLQTVKDLFQKLSAIEINHQKRLLSEYNRISGQNLKDDLFDAEVVAPIAEGGISTEELLERFHADVDSPADVLDMAMSIEAQALDMYHRASENTDDPQSKEALHQIALEEHEHLKLLGQLFEKI